MSVNKDPSKNGMWLVSLIYKDYNGETKQKCKRGFKTKREGMEWEEIERLVRISGMTKQDIRPKVARFL